MMSTKEQLELRKLELIEIIQGLEDMIKCTNSVAFEAIISNIKSVMNDNIAEEDWKSLKENKSKIEGFRKAEKIITSQTENLKKYKEQLDDIQDKLDHLQLELPLEQLQKPQSTGIFIQDVNDEDRELLVGDVYDTEDGYYLVKKSMEHHDKFAIIRDVEEGEFELQYPKNKARLDGAGFIGNLTDGEGEELEEAKSALRKIYHMEDNQTTEENQESEESDVN